MIGQDPHNQTQLGSEFYPSGFEQARGPHMGACPSWLIRAERATVPGSLAPFTISSVDFVTGQVFGFYGRNVHRVYEFQAHELAEA